MASLNASAPTMASPSSHMSKEPTSFVQSLTLGNVVAVVTAVAFYIVAYSIIAAVRQPKYPNAVPWVGKEGNGWLAGVMSAFKSILHARSWLQEGYNTVCLF